MVFYEFKTCMRRHFPIKICLKLQITWVDFLVAEVFDQWITYGDPTALDAFPHVKKHARDIYELPNVKKYVERRRKNIPF
jgi:hypothetical protein